MLRRSSSGGGRSSAKTLTFVTGNAGKLKEVQEILGSKVKMTSMKVDLPELQGEPEDISREKALLAMASVKGPLIVEDTSLCFNALNGLPGPYIKWFMDKIGHEGLNNLLAAYPDKSAFAVCSMTYMSGPDAKPVTFLGKTPGTIVAARGPKDFGWDPIFQPDGHDKTYAEMDKAVKGKLSHRARALAMLYDHLEANPM